MQIITDYGGKEIRLTNERRAHILQHPEMAGLEDAISETLANPAHVVQSISDEQARLYYRFYTATCAGDKYLCVVVKVKEDDAFVLTAYLTDAVKKGEILWQGKS